MAGSVSPATHDIRGMISVALTMVREDQEIYAQYAREAVRPGLRRLFGSLVQLKAEQEKRLWELERGDVLERVFAAQEGAAAAVRPSHFVASGAFDPGMDYRELLRSALEREQKAAELYGHLRDRAVNDEARLLMQGMCRDESKTQRWISDQLDLLELSAG